MPSLKVLALGDICKASRRQNDEYMQNLDALHRRCLDWSDKFLPAARAEYKDLVNGKIANSEIPAMRRKSQAFSVTFIRLLAGCYQQWTTKVSGDWKPLAQFLRKADLTPGGVRGSLLVDAGNMSPGDSNPVARRQEMQGAINYIVAEAQKAAP